MTNRKNILRHFFYILFIIIFQNSSFAKDVYEITAKKVTYNDNKNIVIAEGEALAVNNLGKKVSSDKMIYYKNQNLIETFGSSKFEDGKIILTANNFKYDIEIKTIEAIKKVVLVDEEKNKYLFSFFKYFENEEGGFGDNMKAYLIDGSYIESETGQTNNKTNITKLNYAKYTTCSNIFDIKNKFCPAWSMQSKNTIHYKKKQMIVHKNAFLKLKNIPVLYSPYFSHPDPSVKRKSGFLAPSIKTVNQIGRTIKTPYFWVISDDKDLTITPNFHFDEHHSIQFSYRQDFENGFLQVENAYTEGYKRLDRTGRTDGSRNYIFVDYFGQSDDLIFEENKINFKIQRISQENYVRVNRINTELFKEDINYLENTLNITSSGDNRLLNFKFGVFESLSSSDQEKYEYIFPDGSYSQSFNNFKNFNLNFNSYFQSKKFSNDQKKTRVINSGSIATRNLINKTSGVSSKFLANLYNRNIYNNNVTNEKNNLNSDNYLTVALENSWPLAKFSKNKFETITPKVFSKYSTGKMINSLNDSKLLEYSDIFSMNRTNSMEKPETGMSFGHGIEYNITKKQKNSNKNLFSASSGIGQVLRTYREDLLPNQSSLNNKSSDFSGFLKFNLGDLTNVNAENDRGFENDIYFKNNVTSFDYKFNLNNDFSKLNRNYLDFKQSNENFYYSIAYDEKNSHIGNTKSLGLDIRKKIKDNYYLALETKRDLKTNATESQDFSINFENDCISYFLAFSKNFYNNKDLQNSKNLIFGIRLKPFEDSFAPDLSNLIQ